MRVNRQRSNDQGFSSRETNGHRKLTDANGHDRADFTDSDSIDDFEENELPADDLKGLGSLDPTDDPVRMYLMQMGQIPLLSRAEEIAAAKQIEKTRRHYRHSMLATDYILQGAVSILEKVYNGELRLDRTIEVSVTNTSEKKLIMRRLQPNLKTLHHLLARNRDDYRVAISKRYPVSTRRAAWAKLVRRRNKAVRLIEELNLRTNRLQPLFEKVTEISNRMLELQCLIRRRGRQRLQRRPIGA